MNLLKKMKKIPKKITKKYMPKNVSKQKSGVSSTVGESIYIGMGQAGAYMSKNQNDIDQLIVCKLKKGLYEYLNQFDKIKKNLSDKNVVEKSVNNEELIYQLLTNKKLISNEKEAVIIAKNTAKIMDLINTIPDKVETLGNKNLPPELLTYYYVLIGFVLDVLSLNIEKDKHAAYIITSEKINLLESSNDLSKNCDLTSVDYLRFFVNKILPNANVFYALSNPEFFADKKIIPIEHKYSLIGQATIVHLIANDLFPVGVGANTAPKGKGQQGVHMGYFLKQRLYTLDHDFQHAWDIYKKSNMDSSMFKYACKEIANNLQKKSEETGIGREIMEDYIAMFYMLHENPMLSKASMALLAFPQKDLGSSKTEMTDKSKKYADIRYLADNIFETGGFLYPFLEIYPEFLKEIKIAAPALKIDERGETPKLIEISYKEFSDEPKQIQALVSIIDKYVATCMENFLNRNMDILNNYDSNFVTHMKTDINKLKTYADSIYVKESFQPYIKK